MILKRITIENFGEIHNKTIEFSPGINVLSGKEESVKNTVAIFVRSMLFGSMDFRGREKKKQYVPETEGEPWGGTLWFETNGKCYRLTRSFDEDTPKCELYCESDKTVLDGAEGNLEKLLGNISETVYDNAVMVEALKSTSDADFVRELQNYLVVLGRTGDNSVNLGRTEQMLKMWRKGYLSQKERSQREINKERGKISSKLENLEAELDELRDKKDQVTEKQTMFHSAAGLEESSSTEEQIRSIEKKNLGMVMAAFLAVLVGIVGIIGSFQFTDEMTKIGMDVCIVAAIVTVIYTLTVRRKLRSDLARLKKKKTRMQAQREKLKWNQENIDEIYKEKLTDFINTQEELREYEGEASLPTSEDLEIQALNQAMETIQKLSNDIYRQKGRKIRIRTSRIFRELTNGKYKEVLLDNEQHIVVNKSNHVLGAEEIGRGDVELIYFALRMAAGESAGDDQALPVVLNHIFTNYDAEHLKLAIHWLKNQSRQIFINTTDKKEKEFLEKEKIGYKEIRL